jgi:hypothetical protein
MRQAVVARIPYRTRATAIRERFGVVNRWHTKCFAHLVRTKAAILSPFREVNMLVNIGVWIDHRKAVLVHLLNESVEVEEIDSDVEKHVRESGGTGSSSPSHTHDAAAGDRRDRKLMNHLNQFYDQVIQRLEHANGILILGPGEAKGELDKRITSKALRKNIVGIETTDKMTDPQLVAKVKNYFMAIPKPIS